MIQNLKNKQIWNEKRVTEEQEHCQTAKAWTRSSQMELMIYSLRYIQFNAIDKFCCFNLKTFKKKYNPEIKNRNNSASSQQLLEAKKFMKYWFPVQELFSILLPVFPKKKAYFASIMTKIKTIRVFLKLITCR